MSGQINWKVGGQSPTNYPLMYWIIGRSFISYFLLTWPNLIFNEQKVGGRLHSYHKCISCWWHNYNLKSYKIKGNHGFHDKAFQVWWIKESSLPISRIKHQQNWQWYPFIPRSLLTACKSRTLQSCVMSSEMKAFLRNSRQFSDLLHPSWIC